MNFFEAQDRSRRNTRRLVVLYVIAMLIIVALVTAVAGFFVSFYEARYLNSSPDAVDWIQANFALLGMTATSTAGFIGLASAYRIARLSGGGSRVAMEMGGSVVASDIADPLRRRLRNVVEEIAIASGVPVPEIYVLEEEAGINAFAAGYNPEDAVIAVTRGTLELLDRDELQGVIAHEFSHILNGDMRLNIRLIGILFGILAIGVIGRFLLRGAHHTTFGRSRNNRGGGAAIAFALGAALSIIGAIGVVSARIIKAGVSRQREFLADASAVQFTRQTTGIAGALKKIAGYQHGSRIRSTDTEEVSHMLFDHHFRGLEGLFATHPPLAERIKALDPAFDTTAIASPAMMPRDSITPAFAPEAAAVAAFSQDVNVEPDAWLDTSGNPESRHVAYASELRRSLPDLLSSATHSRDLSVLLAVALLLDSDRGERQRQLQFLGSRLGLLRGRRIGALYDEYEALGPRYRLPLFDTAFPALKDRPAGQLEFLIDLVDELIALDGKIGLSEYSFARLLQGQLLGALNPPDTQGGRRKLEANGRALKAARTLLQVTAYHGNHSLDIARSAYRWGLGFLPVPPALQDEWGTLEYSGDWVRAADAALEELNRLSSVAKRQVLTALISTARYHAGINIEEAEILRAVAAVLHCPLPPLLAETEQ